MCFFMLRGLVKLTWHIQHVLINSFDFEEEKKERVHYNQIISKHHTLLHLQ